MRRVNADIIMKPAIRETVILQPYFFAGARRRSSSNQLVTVANVEPAPVFWVSSMRKRSPSGVTSHVVPMIILNSSVGTATDGVPEDVWMAADISDAVPAFAVQYSSSRPFLFHRGMLPVPV